MVVGPSAFTGKPDESLPAFSIQAYMCLWSSDLYPMLTKKYTEMFKLMYSLLCSNHLLQKRTSPNEYDNAHSEILVHPIFYSKWSLLVFQFLDHTVVNSTIPCIQGASQSFIF